MKQRIIPFLEDMNMEHSNFNFLTESFLFNDKELEGFSKKYTDEQLSAELNRYCNRFVINKLYSKQ